MTEISIGLDIGYNTTKLVEVRNDEVAFCAQWPSYIASRPLDAATELCATQNEQQTGMIREGEFGFVASTHAAELLPDASMIAGVQLATTADHKRMLHIGLAIWAQQTLKETPAAARASELTVKAVILGLPIDAMKENGQKHAAVEALKSITTIYPFGQAVRLTVEHVEVVPQPYGTYYSWYRTASIEERDLYTAVVDIGGGTTDVLYMFNGRLVPFMSRAIRTGVNNIYPTVLKTLGQQNIRVSELNVHTALVKGHCSIRGVTVTRDMVLNIAEPLLNTITATIVKELDANPEIRQVVITGGGALLLHPRISAQLPTQRTDLISDAALANAAGFAHYGADLQ
jgi:hypothetical protein